MKRGSPLHTKDRTWQNDFQPFPARLVVLHTVFKKISHGRDRGCPWFQCFDVTFRLFQKEITRFYTWRNGRDNWCTRKVPTPIAVNKESTDKTCLAEQRPGHRHARLQGGGPMEQHNAQRRLVQFSTCQVGIERRLPVSDDERMRPPPGTMGGYGPTLTSRSKACGDLALL